MPEILYSLVQKYTAGARREVETYRPQPGPGQARMRLTGIQMRVVKRCFVCAKDRRANEKHKREEVSAANEHLNEKHSAALLTVADLDAIYQMEEEQIREESEPFEAQWGEGKEEESDEREEDTTTEAIKSVAVEDMKETERALLNNVFLLRSSSDGNMMVGAMYAQLQRGPSDGKPFDALLNDTCINRRSIVGQQKYIGYCREFRLGEAIRPT